MKVRILIPDYRLRPCGIKSDLTTFYRNLRMICNELNLDYRLIEAPSNSRLEPIRNTLTLLYHSYGKMPNTWHIKRGYLDDLVYFDKSGYSGWSSLAKSYNEPVMTNKARSKVLAYCSRYIESKQTEESEHDDYILLLGQTLRGKKCLTHIDTDRTAEIISSFGCKVLFKDHPRAPERNYPNCIKVNTPIHSLIPKAKAIYTINSGAGFESLLHKKRVITTGKSDYHWASNEVTNETELRDTIKLIDQPVDEEKILRFLYYCLSRYFINVNDKRAIKHRLLKALETVRS